MADRVRRRWAVDHVVGKAGAHRHGLALPRVDEDVDKQCALAQRLALERRLV